jgi:hypothetical protein
VPAGVECPTEAARLSCGVVEYRLERRGPGAVLMMHGGHMRASPGQLHTEKSPPINPQTRPASSPVVGMAAPAAQVGDHCAEAAG